MKALIEAALAQLQNNQFASGGLVLMVLGAALATLRSVPGALWSLVRNRFLAKLEVTSDTVSYYWLQYWLVNHPYTKRTRNVMLVTERHASSSRTRRWYATNEGVAEEGAEATYSLSLGRGQHLFWWKGRPVWISSDREKNESGATSKAFLYTLTLTSYGMSRATLEQLVNEAQREYQKQTARKAGVWVSRYEDEWSEDKNLALRPLSTLVFDPKTVKQVIEDAKQFLERRDRYFNLGIPFRRGYLLYGPPGTGKTSLAMALAHELQRELCILPLSRPLLDDQQLAALMSSVPENALVLIEDVDAIFRGRENKAGNQVTFSGFLNAVDGVLTQTGQMVVMTTNHIETLDPALIRPGRIDAQIEIGVATTYQATELYRRFFPKHADLAAEFAERFDGETMAQLQERLVRHMDDPTGALEATRLEVVA